MRLTGIMLIITVGAATLAGCALRDARDDYAFGGGADGLGSTSYDLIDWNFPTSVNQGPIEAPKRIQLEKTAIGVTWATRNPLPLKDDLPAQDGAAPASHDGTPAAAPMSLSPGTGADTPARGRDGAR